MQSIPMIQSMQFSNLNLIRKINSGFHHPAVFKGVDAGGSAQAPEDPGAGDAGIGRPHQRDAAKNARNTADQAKDGTAGLFQLHQGGNLEKTWQTIVSGIEEPGASRDASAKRIADAAKLDALKQDFPGQSACNGFPSVEWRDHTFEDICYRKGV